LPQTTLKVFFFVCYDVCLIVWCPISSQADLGFRFCYNLWIEWKIFHGFVMSFYIFVLFFFSDFFQNFINNYLFKSSVFWSFELYFCFQCQSFVTVILN
jgi:hypothetical protein